MDVIIRGHNIRITDALKEYTKDKVGRLDRFLPHISEIRVDISRQHTKRGEDMTIAQITLRHKRGAILRSEEKLHGKDKDSEEAAINLATDKMYRQIERFKGKRRDKKRIVREKYFATAEELDIAEEIPEDIYDEIYADYAEGETNADAHEFEIVRRKEVPVVAMSEDEAIEQMELLGHAFFMFFNQETNSINVLYRRDIGGYGVLVPNQA